MIRCGLKVAIGRVAALAALALGFQAHAAAGTLTAVFTSAGDFYGYRDTDTCAEWAPPESFSLALVRHDRMELIGGVTRYAAVAEPLANSHRGGGFTNWRLPTMEEWISFNRAVTWCSTVCKLVFPPQELPASYANQPYWTSEVSGAMAAAAWAKVGVDPLKMWYARTGTSTKVWPVRTANNCMAPAAGAAGGS